MVWYFTSVYIINRTLHGRLEIRNFSSHVEKIFQSERSERVKYFSTLEKKFRISARPCNILYICLRRKKLGSFSIDDGNGSENVTFKMNSRFFNLCRVYSNLLKMASVREFPYMELISWGPHSILEREKEIRHRLFTSSIKLAIRHFHVVVFDP